MGPFLSGHIYFVVILHVLWFCSAHAGYCKYMLGRNYSNKGTCTKLEHCKYDNCDRRTGQCTGYWNQCEPGWMGPGCQYFNLASLSTQRNNAFDGNMSTEWYSWTLNINFPGVFIVSAANIFLVWNAYSTNLRITANGSITLYSGKMDDLPTVYFRRAVRTNMLMFTFSQQHRIKEIEIFGGKNVALWKETSQSSTYRSYTSDKAVDGWDSNHNFSRNSCMHTQPGIQHPFWKVKLGDFYAIISVYISNRYNNRRINGFTLHVRVASGNEQLVYTDKPRDIARTRNDIWIDSSYMPSELVNEVIIRGDNISSEKIINLCEVYILACRPVKDGTDDCKSLCPKNCHPSFGCLNDNLSCPTCRPGWTGQYCHTKINQEYCQYQRGRNIGNKGSCTRLEHCPGRFRKELGTCTHPRTQCERGWMGPGCQYVNLASESSRLPGKMYLFDGNFDHGYQIFTTVVQLEQIFIVSAMNIHTKAMQKRARITVTNGSQRTCYDGTFPQTSVVYCDGVLKTSTLHITFNTSILVTEIEVFGGRNVALWKATNQSSTLNTNFHSDQAVDGSDGNHIVANNSCSHTANYDTSPTWSVILGKFYSILSMKIANRKGFEHRLNNFQIYGKTLTGSSVLAYEDVNSLQIPREDIWILPSNLAGPFNEITVDGRNLKDQYNWNYPNNKLLTLCEVFIFACRPTESGEECISMCPNNCLKNETCLNADYSCQNCMPGWTGPYCQKELTCSKLTSKGLILIPNRSTFSYNMNVNFECTPGYRLNGSSMAVCGIGGSFIFPYGTPECEEILCTKHISNGVLFYPDQASYKYNTRVKFTCSRGRKLKGPSSALCGPRGFFIFSGAVPQCEEVTCPRRMLMSTGLVLVPKLLSYPYKMQVQFRCALGYKSLGSKTAVCGPDGSFQFPNGTPHCEVITCLEKPKLIHNLKFTPTKATYVYNDIIRFQCDEAFNLIGSNTARCGQNSTFLYQNEQPYCEDVKCVPESTSHLHIKPQKTSYTFNETVLFSCEEGYHLQGNMTAVCGKGNKWNILKFPSCNRIRCSLLKINKHNTLITSTNASDVEYNTVVNFSCTPGFYLGDNDIMRKCLNFGPLNLPKCEVVSCPKPKFIDAETHLNVSIIKDIYAYNEVIEFSCIDGWFLSGSPVAVCSQGNVFNVTDPHPVCLEKNGNSQEESRASLIAGAMVGICLLLVIPVLVILVIRRRRTNKTPSSNIQTDEGYNLSNLDHQYAEVHKPKKRRDSEASENLQNVTETSTYHHNMSRPNTEKAKSDRQDVYYEFTQTAKPSPTAIKVSNLKNYTDSKKWNTESFAQQFKKLYTGLQFPAQAAVEPGNRSKNKYKNIYPYDETRVRLKNITWSSKSDFINASFIHGYGIVKSYIAAQGPLVDTIDDFWWMVWNEGCGKIVMLTNLFEDDRVKCIKYWPDNDKMTAGNLIIEVVDAENFADFTIRTFCLKNGREERMIRHFHFTAWPDKGVPLYASSLVHFYSKVKNTTSQGKGPMVVHCSAGIGRTGTFIALDYLILQAKESGYVDVFGCVETLRRQRVNMVQTLEQYIFVHHALLEALMCTSSDPSTTEFPQLYGDLMKVDPKSGKRYIDVHFEDLLSGIEEVPETFYSFANYPENKKKNRYRNILPVDSEMPELRDEENKRVYINAVFLPGYKTKRSFIVTQMPLRDTVCDFWRLLTDQKVSTIVMLNQTEPEKSNVSQNVGMYWPEGFNSVHYGMIVVTKESSSRKEKEYTVIDLLCKVQNTEDEEDRRIRIFKFNFWPDSVAVPTSIPSFLKLVNAVELHHNRNNSGPVVVHCMNGAEKSGLFCVLQVVLERMKIEQDVAIHPVIQHMRSVRPSIIPNVEQFKFCHDAVMEFMRQYDAYSNFQ